MDRLWRTVEAAPREALESGLTPTDLQSLLLEVMRARARRMTPARVLRRWRDDRFVQPSVHDPRAITRLEARLWELLPETFVGVDLSPVAPLGTCSAVAPVDQNRVLSTIRGTEVLSDPTNGLAVEAADRRSRVGRRHRVGLRCSDRRRSTWWPSRGARREPATTTKSRSACACKTTDRRSTWATVG